MLVLAGPGTGKTRVITHRIAHLIRERGVAPRSIVAVTFTVRAAEALRSRVAELVTPTAAEGIFAGTFHSFARQIVRRFPDRMGFDRAPVIMDGAMRRRLLRDVVAKRAKADPAGAAGGEDWIDHLRKVFAQFHHHALSAEQLRERVSQRELELARGVWSEHGEEQHLDETGLLAKRDGLDRLVRTVDAFEDAERERRDRCSMGFDELLTEPIELLRRDTMAAAVCRDEYRHVVVDEFQDTNPAQAELLALLSPPRAHGDLMVVGDDDQSIYGFRGADDLAFDRFAQRWGGCAQVRLERNYRSKPVVVAAANAVMSRAFHRFAPDKEIEPGGGEPGDVSARGSEQARVELLELTKYKNDGEAIARLIRADREQSRACAEVEVEVEVVGEPRAWNSYAVIVRSHNDGERIASALELAGIPFWGRRPDGVASDPGVQRLLSWVELLSDPKASWAIRGVLGTAPISAPADARVQWEREYSAQRSRCAQEQAMPGFAAWLADRLTDDEDQENAIASPEERSAIERFAALYIELQAIACEQTAERLVLEVVRRAGLADSELLSGHHRAARVRNLVTAIGFVRRLQPKLPKPADVAALWAYYQDLDPDEQTMGKAIGEDALEQEGADDSLLGADADAVQIITAHSAKGLEFDTVFIPRVFPSHGYPKSKMRDALVPDGMLVAHDDDQDDSRDDKQRMYDEERRLFYVALTRAERRAVIITNKTKKPSKSIHFAQQLAADLGSGLERLDESAVLESQKESLEHELAKHAAASKRVELERLARRKAADALAQAGSAKDSQSFDRALEIFRASAATIAAQGFAKHGDEVPAWLDAGEVVQPDESVGVVFAPVKGPLHLSYTMLSSYLRCPRCWYLNRVLKLPEEMSEASLVGKAVHTALQRFYDELRTAESVGESLPGLDAMRAHAERAYLSMLPRDEVVRADVLERVIAMACSAHEHLHERESEILELEYKVVVPWPDAGAGSELEIRIDRLDRLGEGHRIVDYKTGKARKALLEPPADDLQMGLYAEVLGRAMEGINGGAEYWILQTGQRGRIELSDLDTSATLDTIAQVVDGIRKGEFEASKDCSSCEWLDSQQILSAQATGRVQQSEPPGVAKK